MLPSATNSCWSLNALMFEITSLWQEESEKSESLSFSGFTDEGISYLELVCLIDSTMFRLYMSTFLIELLRREVAEPVESKLCFLWPLWSS